MRLSALANELPNIMVCDRAPSTVSKYYNSFERWQKWATSFGLPALPAKGAQLALYLCELVKKSKSPGPILSAVYGVSWAHRKALAPDPCSHPLVVQVREAARRLLGRPTTRKENLTRDNIRAIVKEFGQVGSGIADLQIVTMITVGFAGFLRWNDLSNINFQDIRFHDSYMSILLRKRKNDQYHKGTMVNITRSQSDYCPVALTERFIARAGILCGPMFREIQGHGSGKKISNNKLRYGTARAQALRMFAAIGLNAKRYGLHSLRSGGASTASQAGVPERLISSHGGWKSESSRNCYIRDNNETLLSVSRALQM